MSLIPEIVFGTVEHQTWSATYETVPGSSFLFMGTDVYGHKLSYAKTKAGIVDADSQDIQLYDVTHSQVIAEVIGITATFPSLVDLGGLDNLPTGPSLLELRTRRVSASSKSVKVAGITVG